MATASMPSAETRQSAADAGLLILRLVLGILILIHGLTKLPPPSSFVVGALGNVGLPAFLAYGVYIGEILGPVLIIVGVWTRLGALLIAVNMVVAVTLAHPPDFFALSGSGGYVQELQAMYFFTAVALVLLGAGSYSVAGRHGRFN
jgi:putative oxidoreductase